MAKVADINMATDWQWIGTGLVLDWHRIGNRLTEAQLGWLNLDWRRIGTRLAKDRLSRLTSIGTRLVLDWHRIG